MKRMKRMASTLLAGVMALSLMPLSTLAAEDTDNDIQEMVVDGVTYFNANSEHFEDSNRLFFQDLLSNQNANLQDEESEDQTDEEETPVLQSTASLWQYLAYAIQDRNGQGTSDGKFKTQFDDVMKKSLAANTGEVTGDSTSTSSGDNDYDVHWTGLQYAGSIASAARQMEEDLFEWYQDAGGGRDDIYATDTQSDEDAAIKQNATLASQSGGEDCFWMFSAATKTSGTNKKGHYQALGIIFSNFAVSPVEVEYNTDYYQTTQTEPVTGGRDYLSTLSNDTNLDVTQSQSMTNSYTTTFTSTINGSENYSYGETITGNLGGSIKGLNIGVSVAFAASQAFESGWSESNSETYETSQTINASVSMAPYTHAVIRQYDSETTTTTVYECPVALSFDVTIVEYTLDPSSNNASCRTNILATFSGTAREDLHQRAVVEKTLTDGDRISWSTLYKDHTDLESRVERIAATAPMSTTGATMEVKEESTTSQVNGLIASYPLDRVATTNSLQWITVSPEAPYYLNNIALEGYNRYNGVYYGFNKLKGQWILLDENGQETTSSDIATLTNDPVTGFPILKAGTKNGTVYIKYQINEDCYDSAESQKVYATNDTLSKTAVIEVRVQFAEDEFLSGFIYVDGTLTGIVGDEPQPIEDSLSVRMEDLSGKEVSYPVTWEAKELNGVTVENNMISFSAPGTYHVRACAGEVTSDWVAVTAQPARTLDSVTAPDSVEMDVAVDTFLDLSAYAVETYDQYGDPWQTDSQAVWTCTSGGGTVDEEGFFSAPGAGDYVVQATVDGIASAPTIIHVISDTQRALEWAIESDLTTADSLDAFRAKDECTRAEAMTFLWRAAGSPAPTGSENPFVDVKEGDYFYDAVLWAVETGVTNGTSETTFSPNAPCTRGQIVTFLWNHSDNPKVSQSNGFVDVEYRDYFDKAVKWAGFSGVTTGTSETTFSPDNHCTREQMVTFLYRLFEK